MSSLPNGRLHSHPQHPLVQAGAEQLFVRVTTLTPHAHTRHDYYLSLERPIGEMEAATFVRIVLEFVRHHGSTDRIIAIDLYAGE